MKTLIKIFLIVIVVMALTLSIASLPLEETEEEDSEFEVMREEYELPSGQNGAVGRLLAQQKLRTKRRRLTCKKFPRICHAKGSPGPHCCKKNCVNVLTDRFNCGLCGKKCKYNEICCNGKCVNPSFNKRHCGGCNNKCGSGSFCAFGLCNYA